MYFCKAIYNISIRNRAPKVWTCVVVMFSVRAIRHDLTRTCIFDTFLRFLCSVLCDFHSFGFYDGFNKLLTCYIFISTFPSLQIRLSSNKTSDIQKHCSTMFHVQQHHNASAILKHTTFEFLFLLSEEQKLSFEWLKKMKGSTEAVCPESGQLVRSLVSDFLLHCDRFLWQCIMPSLYRNLYFKLSTTQ